MIMNDQEDLTPNYMKQLANVFYSGKKQQDEIYDAGMKNPIDAKQESSCMADGLKDEFKLKGADYNNYYFIPDKPESKSLYEKPKQQLCGKYDVYSIRRDFPILHTRVNGKPLIWLDNAATTQKPLCVINELNRYYREYNSNIHRGAHTLSNLATDAYESARGKIQKLIGASIPDEVVFLRGTTEAVNLVAQSYGRTYIKAGDEILLTTMEHHSNIVPWQMLCSATGAVIKEIPINEKGEVILEEYEKLLGNRTKLVALAHVSNVLGTINPVENMIRMAHDNNACVLVDGAQSVPHIPVNVSKLDADFYTFSGHKIYGPTGIGVLYGKKQILEKMPPWQGGGGMIRNVSLAKTSYSGPPSKFEAGTPNIAGAVGLGSAVEYVQKAGIHNIEEYERSLTKYSMDKLSEVPGLTLIGNASRKTSVLTFVLDGIIPDVAARYLNQEGIALRVGHHCAQPTLNRYNVKSAIRASLGMYNTGEEIDKLVESIHNIVKYYR